MSTHVNLFKRAAWSMRRLSYAAEQLITTEVIDDHVCAQTMDDGETHHWVFIGAPSVGKGTYCSRLSKLVGIPHISMGELVRDELKSPSLISQKFAAAVTQGKLLPDEIVLDILYKRLQKGVRDGERGYVLDGFPRTISQAVALEDIAKVDLAANLQLREDVLITKCLGRRICRECGGNFNLTEVKAKGIHMPRLLPPPACAHKMTTRADDTIDALHERLRIYHRESAPVEEYYRMRGKLVNLNVAGGIPETWPKLLTALNVKLDKTSY